MCSSMLPIGAIEASGLGSIGLGRLRPGIEVLGGSSGAGFSGKTQEARQDCRMQNVITCHCDPNWIEHEL